MTSFLAEREVVIPIAPAERPFWNRPGELEQIETPCFVFDPARIMGAYRSLKAALGTPLLISIKANSNPDVLVRCVHEFSDGVEVASIGELNVVVGRAPGPKYVASPALDEALILAACACRARLVLDSPAQAELVIGLKERFRSPPQVLIRLNAGALLRDHVALKADHFGVEPEKATHMARALQSTGIDVVGLHVFAGSGSFRRTAPFIAAEMSRAADLVSEACGHPLTVVDLGGGFDEDWAADPELMRAYRMSLEPLKARMTVLHEAGRAVFGPGGTFMTRVVSVKELDGERIVVCDGGIAHAFRLAQTEIMVKRRWTPLVISKRPSNQPGELPVRFVGNSCNPADVIGVAQNIAPPRVGDMVVFDRCGAYHSYTPAAFLNLKAARKYLIS